LDFFRPSRVAPALIGGLAGGRISVRFGRMRSIAIFLIGFSTTVLALAAIDGFQGAGASVLQLLGIYTALYLCIGLFTAASYAFYMDLTDPTLRATQFSTSIAASNGCEAWSTWLGGRLAAWSGYAACYLVMSLVSLSSLVLLRRIAAKATSVERLFYQDFAHCSRQEPILVIKISLAV